MEGTDSQFPASSDGPQSRPLSPGKSPPTSPPPGKASPTSPPPSKASPTSPPPDFEEKTIHVKFLLSNDEAGCIIGKGGSTIKDFQTRSGAVIKLSRNFEYFPGTIDRIVMVSGKIDDVLEGVDLILTKLLEKFFLDAGRADPQFKVNLVVSNSSCGGIIGKGGSMIKSLIEVSHASIKVAPLNTSFPGLYDRLVTVDGTLGEHMRAIELILLKLAEDPSYVESVHAPFPYAAYRGMNYVSEGVRGKFQNTASHNKEEEMGYSMTIGIADEHMGLVLGRGGRNISQIRQLSGARIIISERGDFMSGTSYRKVTITGTPRAIRMAEAMIYREVSSVLRDDGAGSSFCHV